MRKVFNKVLAGFTSVALVATLLVGINATKNVNAADTVALKNWSFTQGGQYNPSEGGNEGYITQVVMNGTGETVTGWLKEGEPSVNQKQTTSSSASGFTMDIANTGWDATWNTDPLQINPWSIQASMDDVDITPGHIYTVSFKAHASKKKYAYVAFNTSYDGYEMAPYGDGNAPEGDAAIIELGVTDKTYTYTFTNWVSGQKLSTVIMLGSFNGTADYAGNLIADYVPGFAPDTVWDGTVYVSDFSIVDNGRNPDFEDVPTAWPGDQPTQAPTTTAPQGGGQPTTNAPQNPATQAPTTAAPKKLAQVKNVKATSKGGKVTVKWKKVANGKKYQVKVGTKSYTVSKTKYVVKKGLTKGKSYKVKVRAKAANGYKAGAWSKAVKVKVK